jgi:hypothetical protein
MATSTIIYKDYKLEIKFIIAIDMVAVKIKGNIINGNIVTNFIFAFLLNLLHVLHQK